VGGKEGAYRVFGGPKRKISDVELGHLSPSASVPAVWKGVDSAAPFSMRRFPRWRSSAGRSRSGRNGPRADKAKFTSAQDYTRFGSRVLMFRGAASHSGRSGLFRYVRYRTVGCGLFLRHCRSAQRLKSRSAAHGESHSPARAEAATSRPRRAIPSHQGLTLQSFARRTHHRAPRWTR
jgi:hypothetical protein